MISLGIDPASSGAAIVLDETTIICAVLWRKAVKNKRKVYKVQILNIDKNRNHSTELKYAERAADIGYLIAKLKPMQMGEFNFCIEDCYVSKNPRTAILISRFSGSIAAPIEATYGVGAFWVNASNWRKAIIDVKHFTKREECKRMSLERVPKKVHNMDIVLSELGVHDHLTDAAGLALYSKAKKSGVIT